MTPQSFLLDVKLLSRSNKVLLCQLLFKGFLWFQCCFHPDFSPVLVGSVAVSWLELFCLGALTLQLYKVSQKKEK